MAKLHAAEHPASVEMVGALENALIACLTAPADSAKPNAQGVSSVWWVAARGCRWAAVCGTKLVGRTCQQR